MSAKGTTQTSAQTVNNLQYMLVAPENLDHAWAHAVPLLEKGQGYLAEHLSLHDIYTAIGAGRMQLWLVNDTQEIFYAALTELIDYPQKRVLHIIYQGGTRMREALQFLDCI